MMKNFILVTSLFVLMVSAARAFSSPAEDAISAYQKGDYAKAAGLWDKMALEGDARAMHNLGVLNEQGLGVPKNLPNAARLYQAAAKAGNASAMSDYGRLLEQGTAVEQNLKEAGEWFRKAADLNQPEAQYNLGLMYEKGQGFPKSDKEAAAWYSRAAAQGQADAMARLGVLYKEGRGIKQNTARAVLMLYGAAMEGRKDAIEALKAMASKDPNHQNISLFGEILSKTARPEMRKALAASKAKKNREDLSFICDTYDVSKAVPGALELAACYGPGSPQPLGFIKIDYPAPNEQHAEKVKGMVIKRFGKPDVSENVQSSMWNMGDVILATQYTPSLRQISLMYMLPSVYYLTRAER